MHLNETVQQALRQVNALFAEVTQVFFGADGRWQYCTADFDAPAFYYKVDIGLLEAAAAAADQEKGLPCAYRLLGLPDYYQLWDALGDIPVSESGEEDEADTIEASFLHFSVGTRREVIWRWFEAQHPDFVVGEVMQGIRRLGEEAQAS